MSSSDNPEKALEQFQSIALVEHGWIPTQGYLIIAIVLLVTGLAIPVIPIVWIARIIAN